MKLSDRVIAAAFDRLFPNCTNNPLVLNDFKQYVNNDFSRLHCVVLYAREGSFSEFLEKHHLNSEKREVIITDNNHLLFSNDWRKEPKPVLF